MELTEDVRRINGVEVHFPYKPYPSQISMMAKIIAGLKNKQNCLLESPTGSGKSLALLCSALAWQASQQELARKEDQERSEYENSVCSCSCGNAVAPVPGVCPTPQQVPLMSPHFPTAVAGDAAPTPVTPISTHPRSLLNKTNQEKITTTAAQTLSHLAAKAKVSDDDDFKNSTTKFRTPGSSQPVSRLPVQIAYQTTAKPVTVKFLSKGPNGELTEQKQVLILPVHTVPGQAVPVTGLAQAAGQTVQGIGQSVPLQVLNPTSMGQPVPLQVLNPSMTAGRSVPLQVSNPTVTSAPVINPALTTGQGVVSGGVTTPARVNVPVRKQLPNDMPRCSCDCKFKSPPPPKRRIPKIYFGTRTHKQIAQIVRELRKTFYKDVKMTILASREHTCIHPGVSKSSTKNDGCRDLLDGPGCLFNNNVRKISTQNALQNFYGKDTAWDIEDLVSLCSESRIKACPYYVSRGLRGESDIIFCPYNYLVDPIIRKTMEINLKEEIIILDEAHNIEDSAREAVSKSIEHDNILKIIKELEDLVKREVKEFEHQELLQMCIRLDEFIRRTGSQLEQTSFDQASTVWAGMDIVARLVQVGLGPKEFPALQRVLAAVCEEDEVEKRRNGGFPPPRISVGSASVLEALFTMLDFLYRDDLRFVEDYRVAIVRSMTYSQTMDTSGQWLSSRKNRGRREMRQVFTLNFWCLNPAVAFSDFTVVRNVVLTSGTLSPMSSFSSELGMSFPISLEANHVIKDSQVWVGSIGEGPSGGKLQATFRNTETLGFQDELGRLVLEVCRAVPHGVLCFLPSYKMLDKLSQRWQATGLWGEMIQTKKIIAEPRRGDKADFDDLLRYFYNVIGGEDSDCDYDEAECEGREVDGALFLAVCRGKVSEGLDFADNNARAVITVGIPFPNVKDIQVELKRKYNDRYTNERGLLTGSEWYEIQAYRALNQALGRCIRHRNDWGALIMIDDRFVRQPQKYIKGLSKWVRNKAQTFGTFRQAIKSLRSFTQLRLKAGEGDSSNISEIPVSQGQSSCLETPIKTGNAVSLDAIKNGDNVADLPTPSKLLTSTPHANGLSIHFPTSTPIGRLSPPMSLPNRTDISTVKTEDKENSLENTIGRADRGDKESVNSKTTPETKQTGIHKFFKFCNISTENNNNNNKLPSEEPIKEEKQDVERKENCVDVKPEETMNDEDFLMSTPNLFDSDMSDPENDKNVDAVKDTKPVAKRPLFRRAPPKGCNSGDSDNLCGRVTGETGVKEDGHKESRAGVRRAKTRKHSSDSDYVPADEDFDEALNTRRSSRNRKRKVVRRTDSSNKRSKGVDFLDDCDEPDGKSAGKLTVKGDGSGKDVITCARCEAALVNNVEGREKRKRLPSFLRGIWNQRGCENVFISQGKITPQLIPVTCTTTCSGGAQLNSHWDVDSQCCVQYLRCGACSAADQTLVIGARIAVASERSDFKAGQAWLQAANVT